MNVLYINKKHSFIYLQCQIYLFFNKIYKQCFINKHTRNENTQNTYIEICIYNIKIILLL